jgi:glycosyltransferase involved in cell wall biosynthesis
MHVLICNERFLFRFGVDRVLLLLAKGFRAAGHRVTLMANRFDPAIVSAVADRVITVPEREGEYLNGNEITAEWIETAWPELFDGDSGVDVAIVGGWPFFASIPILKTQCGCVLYVDCGAVPLDGYSGGMLITQQKLRDMRRKHLPHASQILAISEFIRRTQSDPDSGSAVTTRSVLLAADHIEMPPLWSASGVRQASVAGSAVRTAQQLRASGKKLILNLGRWEPGCYKNSLEALEVLRHIRRSIPDAVLLVLENDLAVPTDLQDLVVPIGFPDDAELATLMRSVDVGVSVSLWEGFNLPVAELQWVGTPTLAFNLAAHPEVIASPWCLCENAEDMASKAVAILSAGMPHGVEYERSLKQFRETFRWERFVAEYISIIEQRMHSAVIPVVDVTNSTVDPANSGVIRVTRRLCRELQNVADPLFVVWDAAAGQYVFPTATEYAQLGQYNGPVSPAADRVSLSTSNRRTLESFLSLSAVAERWLIITETVPAQRLVAATDQARALGLRCAAIFYDAIPVLRPELCNEETRSNHAGYMKTLAGCDLVVPISKFSAECLRNFWTDQGIAGSTISPNPLPGEFGGAPRATTMTNRGGAVEILCVSTIEPRKNHRRLIAACERIGREHPDIDWTLTLIGNRYAGAFDLAAEIEAVTKRNDRIRWLGIVDDAALAEAYRTATFTVYPSLIEGFGMPVLESIWHGKPCICANTGVMAEHASEGGCLPVDVQNENAIYAGILQLSTDLPVWQELSKQALHRPIKTWEEYTSEFMKLLRGAPKSASAERTTSKNKKLAPAVTKTNEPTTWVETLYPDCLLNNWQMNDSERLALTALLARHKPACSIEIGTYHGGSLSLIAQYSEAVISIDIDPAVIDRIGPMQNVHYVTGPSIELLPNLLRQLTEAAIPVDFILIDGDHSAEGVKRDISIILDYIPRKPMFVLMHDSFNPGCRRGMLESDWAKSPWCHHVDLDFVPGRIVEHGGPSRGEMWGGLAMAYFSPVRRTHALDVKRTCEGMFQQLSRADQTVALGA